MVFAFATLPYGCRCTFGVRLYQSSFRCLMEMKKDAELETPSLSVCLAARGGACFAYVAMARAGVLRCMFVARMLGGWCTVHACFFLLFGLSVFRVSVGLPSVLPCLCRPRLPTFSLSLSFFFFCSLSLPLSLFPPLLVLLCCCCNF